MVNLSPHPVNQETQTSGADSTVIKEWKTTIKGEEKKEFFHLMIFCVQFNVQFIHELCSLSKFT